MPDASIRQVRRVPSWDADRSRAHQGRPAPPPRPRIVDACAALAGLGFGAVLAAVITGESRGSLAAPGGMLIAAGRLAGFTGAYLMLIMVMLVDRERTRLHSSHLVISYAVFCLKKKKKTNTTHHSIYTIDRCDILISCWYAT